METKLERLRRVEREFGTQYVRPYRACRTREEILEAVREFERQGMRPHSLRTDHARGDRQGLLLPFVYPEVDPERAERLWDRYGDSLVYIVCRGVLPEETRCNVAAQRLGDTILLVEWDEGGGAQRAWEHQPVGLRHEYVDRWGSWVRPVSPWDLVRVRPPRALPAWTGIDRMYEPVLAAGWELTVWTRCTDGKIVVW